MTHSTVLATTTSVAPSARNCSRRARLRSGSKASQSWPSRNTATALTGIAADRKLAPRYGLASALATDTAATAAAQASHGVEGRMIGRARGNVRNRSVSTGVATANISTHVQGVAN